MNELQLWLDTHKISYTVIDKELVELPGFGKMLVADLKGVSSIFRGEGDNMRFNLMENEQILIAEEIYYVAFPFGNNWYHYDVREEFRFNILKYIGQRQPTQCRIPFVNLGIHTPYELLNGSGDLSTWIAKAKYLGHDVIGICDRNTMAGTLNLQKECAKAGIKHVFGYSFTLELDGQAVDMKIYCQSQQGLQNLLRIQKEIMVDSERNVIDLTGLLSHAAGNVLVLGKLASYWMEGNRHLLQKFREAFDGVYYQIDLSEYKADRNDVQVLQATKFFFENLYDPILGHFDIEPVLICDCYYPDQDDAQSKIILNKIAEGAAHEQSDDQYSKDTDEHLATLKQVFDEDKWNVVELMRRLCANTIKIAQGAEAKYELGRMFMPDYLMRPEEVERYGTPHKLFLGLLEEGLQAKVPAGEHDRYRERLKEEIYIIESTNNVDYFLIQWDMIEEAHRRGIVSGIGRGSAGGSLVSYLLGIISIDPIQYNLLFSRFLVPERCGLNWVDAVSVIKGELSVEAGGDYVEVWLDGKRLRFDRDAQFRALRQGEEITVYADQLEREDDIIFDSRDMIWTLKEMASDE